MGLSITSNSDISSLFSSLSTSTSSSNSSSSSGVSLLDYSSIRNGSYYKLLKSYYANEAASSSSAESKETTQSLASVNSSAKDLKSAAAKLNDSSLYQKTTTKDEDGNETTGYDTDKIYSAVKGFVDSYNSVVEDADDIDNKSILRTTINMINLTSKNSSLLADIGITIGSDHQMTLDEEKFKSADMTTVKSLFGSAGSYGAQASASATNIMNYSVSAISERSGGSYTSSGAKTSADVLGTLYNSYS